METLAESVLKAAGADAPWLVIIGFLLWERYRSKLSDDQMKYKLWRALLQMSTGLDQIKVILRHLRK